jgi:hypothetical protein
MAQREPLVTTVTNKRLFFFLIKPTDALIFSKFIFVKKLYMFRAVPLPITRSFPLYIRHWYTSSNLHDIYKCRTYRGKLLMMGRGTARNMYSFLTKINLEKLVRLLVLLKRNVTMQHGHMDVTPPTALCFTKTVIH